MGVALTKEDIQSQLPIASANQLRQGVVGLDTPCGQEVEAR